MASRISELLNFLFTAKCCYVELLKCTRTVYNHTFVCHLRCFFLSCLVGILGIILCLWSWILRISSLRILLALLAKEWRSGFPKIFISLPVCINIHKTVHQWYDFFKENKGFGLKLLWQKQCNLIIFLFFASHIRLHELKELSTKLVLSVR
jgi:hypothetical protein